MSTDPKFEIDRSAESPEGELSVRRRLVTYDYRRLGLGISGLFVFLLVWWVASLSQPAFVLPSPPAVAESFSEEMSSGEMPTALRQSLRHWIPGAVVGTTLGIGTGLALGWSRLLDDIWAPVVRLLRPVPPLALIGFAIAWFGINDTGAAFIIAIGAFWINFYATYGGVESVSTDLLDVARSLGVTGNLGLLRSVVLPAASPEILTGIRTSIGRSWMLVVAAEIFGVPGIGARIQRASNNLQVDTVIAYILLLSLTFLVIDTLFRWIQRRLLRWH
jgi:NitT/TauT family transport system permease protein